MADEEQLAILRQGPEAWNAWRENHPDIRPDLFKADLHGTDLSGAHLDQADLHGADLSEAALILADLSGADLSGTNLGRANLGRASLNANFFKADLEGAFLDEADLRMAILDGANLFNAYLGRALLAGAILRGADLSEAVLNETVLADLDLSSCKGLDSCRHHGPSIIDHRTLQRSGPLPLIFLRGVGLPDNLIGYLPSLLNQPIQFYSCFISYSSKDQAFADQLHADLQAKSVRCWLASEDMKIGAKILDTIDEAIRLRDKVLLVLSDASLASEWVEDEVTKAFAEERQRKQVILMPVRIDGAVLETGEAWAVKLRDRYIGDFTRWKDPDTYSKDLDRLLRDLKVATDQPAAG